MDDSTYKDTNNCKRGKTCQASWRGRGMPRTIRGDSSPGSKIVVPNGVVATYIRFVRHPGHHHFFIIFPTPFLIDFGSILAPQIHIKSIKKHRWKKSIKKLPVFGADFSSIFNRFGIQLNLKKHTQKTLWGVSVFVFSLLLLQDRFQHVLDIVFASICLQFWLPNPFRNASKNLSKKTSNFESIFIDF